MSPLLKSHDRWAYNFACELSGSKSSAGEASTAVAAPNECLESACKKKKGKKVKRIQDQKDEDYFNSRFN
ncbi:hypothetical protein Tco_0080149 [Tanacetum coccineum]